MDLTKYLVDLENRIDEQEEENLLKEWINFADKKCEKSFFVPTARKPKASKVEWEKAYINDALKDIDLMIYRELCGVSKKLENGDNTILAVRPNYGTGIITSLFGSEMFMMDKELDTLPASKPLPNGTEDIERLIKEGVPSLDKGLAPTVFEFGRRYTEVVANYPKIKKYVNMYNPDLQGPFDAADLLWGNDIFLEFYEDEPILCEFEEIVTQTIINFLTEWQSKYKTVAPGYSTEWGLLHKGGIIVRNDSAVNISAEQYREYVKPYDERIIEKFGGGIHFCGRCDHAIGEFTSIKNLSCINMSQPHLNDMDKIYAQTVEKGVCMIGLSPKRCKIDFENNRDMHGLIETANLD